MPSHLVAASRHDAVVRPQVHAFEGPTKRTPVRIAVSLSQWPSLLVRVVRSPDSPSIDPKKPVLHHLVRMVPPGTRARHDRETVEKENAAFPVDELLNDTVQANFVTLFGESSGGDGLRPHMSSAVRPGSDQTGPNRCRQAIEIFLQRLEHMSRALVRAIVRVMKEGHTIGFENPG